MPKENVYPRKERPENKIDGAITLIVALGRQMVAAKQPTVDDFLSRPVFGYSLSRAWHPSQHDAALGRFWA